MASNAFSLPIGFTALIAVSPFACAAFTASCVATFWMPSTASIAALATSALAAAFSSSDKLVFLSISANLASAAVWMASNAFSLPIRFTALIAVSPFVFAASTASCVAAFWMASTASIAALATSAFAAAFSSADRLVFLSISANLASVVVWIASKAFSFPTGFTALIAVSPSALAASTTSCVVAFWIASTALIAAFATSALAIAFSSADNLSFLSISAIFSSAAFWIASNAFSLPIGFTALIAFSPSAWDASTASFESAFLIASTASIAAFATSAFAADFSSSDNLVLLSISCSFAAFSALIAVIAVSFSIASFPFSFAELIPSSVVALSIASVASFASLATFAFSSVFCSGVKLVLASIASVAFLAASAISFLAASLSISFNDSAALSKAVFAASTFAWAAWTSALDALFSFANTAAASFLATSNWSFNFSNSASYTLILSAVFPVVSAFFNASESVFNLAFSSVVAATIKPSLACCKAVFLAFTFSKAADTCSGVAFSSLITVKAAAISVFAASFAALYDFAVSVVFPGVGSSFTKASNSAFEFVNPVLSVFKPDCLANKSCKACLKLGVLAAGFANSALTFSNSAS